MKSVPDETADLLETLLFTLKMIIESSGRDKQRIVSAYHDARSFISTVDFDGGSARPRIEACLERFHAYKEDDDVAAAGWMLTAIQERVAERNLYGWRKLQDIVDLAVQELLLYEQTLLH